MRRLETEDGPRYEMPGGQLLTEAEYDTWLDGIRVEGPVDLHIEAGWRNFKSDGLAVHPDQVDLATERNRLHGVNVTYDREYGRAIIPDRHERKKLLKVERFHDNDGGYGD